MTVLPEPTPTATAAGQATNPLTDAIIDAAVDHAIQQARQHDTSPHAVIGNTPPVPQEGRPPMSSKAVDDTARMIGASVLIATSGGATTAILWASGHANPTVVAIVFGAPTALVLAISRLAKHAKKAQPEQHHHHYAGPVYQDQRNVRTKNTGVWAKTTNQQ
ncbi:hypothetical protein ACFY2M_19335 [Streptomyces sp. NPDC001276]|uniref:hypothetical protein n=1 Tax=Streptomyces sp. NPDC001276 TaxID=3364555 RepID=UPI0036A04019